MSFSRLFIDRYYFQLVSNECTSFHVDTVIADQTIQSEQIQYNIAILQ